MGRHAAQQRRRIRRIRTSPIRFRMSPLLLAALSIGSLATAVTVVDATTSATLVRGSGQPAPPLPVATPSPAAAAAQARPDASAPATPSASADPTASTAATTTAAASEITLAFGGDVHFSGRTAARADAGAQALGPIRDTLAAADLSMVNLEASITDGATPEPGPFRFRAPATALDSLRASGVDVVTLANNHAADYGAAGIRQSLTAIGDHQLPVVGFGANADAAYAPWTTTIRGVRVAVLAASQLRDRTLNRWSATATAPGIASAYSDRFITAVRAASRDNDVVVVYLTWGVEGQECPTSGQRDLARTLAEAGADVIVGSHAHLLLGDGWLGSSYVSYGLGNFLWWRDNAMSNDTGVLTVTVRGDTPVRASFTPARLDARGVPLPADGAAAQRIDRTRQRVAACSGLADQPGR